MKEAKHMLCVEAMLQYSNAGQLPSHYKGERLFLRIVT